MNDPVNLEKLAELRDRGIIDEATFEEQKRTIFAKAMRETGEHGNPKSGIVYILLAWFLGTIGIHNFYAGYVVRASVQLLLTLFSPMFLFVPLIVTALWAFAELLFQNKSRGGRRFGGSRIIIRLLRLASIVWFGFAVYSVVFVQFDIPLELPSEEDMLVEK